MDSLVDLKAVGRPGIYGGEEDRWPESSFGLRAYVVMAKIIVPEELDRIETRDTVIGQSDWPEDTVSRSTTFDYLLCMLCKGGAQTVLRRVPRGHGFEAWRLLSSRYEHRGAINNMTILQTILAFDFGTKVEGLADKISEFEAMVQENDAQTE